MSNKVIFLDIDGVLVHTGMREPGSMRIEKWDNNCVVRLGRICKVTGAKIVVHSSWARIYKPNELQQMFKDAGLLEHLHPDFAAVGIRDGNPGEKIRSIKFWLSQHPEVSKYIILEDDLIASVKDEPLVWIISGWSKGGLQKRDAEVAIALLS
jgi:predicted membrane-bound dolichyl-phosphate-mannose-protein mannosyltransferase